MPRAIALLFLSLTSFSQVTPLAAEPIPVQQTQGTSHGFLVLRSESGTLLAHGEFIQAAHGTHITSRLIFHFLDGSIDDDTTTYTQRNAFHMVSDHHIQKGSYFPRPSDFLVRDNGDVTSRSIDKDGKQKVEHSHIDLPADCYNGLIGTVLLNVPPNAQPFQLSFVAPTGKGRIVQLDIAPDGQARFVDTGLTHTATVFRIKIKLGGVTGVVAPIVGKQPADALVWVYEGGPLVSIQLSGIIVPTLDASAPK
jgi:hypothetical protein